MKKEPAGLKSTSNNQSPPATKATITKKDGFNFSTQSNYKKFSNFLKESNKTTNQSQQPEQPKQQQQNRKKKTKHIECNCWVCKILDSSVNNEADTITPIYEAYNIVSETGDSIFYDPLVSNLNDVLNGQQIYVAEDKIR